MRDSYSGTVAKTFLVISPVDRQRDGSFASFLVILALTFSFILTATSLAHAEAITTHYPEPREWIAFGDIHGDDKVLEQVLLENKIVDHNLKWIAKDLFVVCTGDLLDRGPNSRRVMDILMRLQNEAAVSGGHLVVLNGNHELMVTRRDLRHFPESDAQNYASFAEPRENANGAIRRAFSGESPYAKWIANRPTAITVGKTLFIHAGVDKWMKRMPLAQINEMMREWFLYFQGERSTPPPRETEWMIGETGPLWTRETSAGRIPPETFFSWLDAAGIERVVVGHTVTDSRVPELPSIYKGRYVMIDTGMSSAYDGEPSSIRWSKTGTDQLENLQIATFPRWKIHPACAAIFGK